MCVPIAGLLSGGLLPPPGVGRLYWRNFEHNRYIFWGENYAGIIGTFMQVLEVQVSTSHA